MITRWWKCDLQVATPAWRFTMPPGSAFDFSRADERARFADVYMQSLVGKGIEVIALADHNTGEWIDTMVAAGGRHNVVVFPGCEVTTGSGADGIHILVIGDPAMTSVSFDRLLAGPLGFTHDHPRYHAQGDDKVPGSSGRTLLQILDDLPDSCLVIAPHALTDNGIASGNTVQGDLRWKALHHERLGAVDPGDCSVIEGPGFNDSFRRRELDYFPCLRDLAFVSTSDAYRLEDLGRRFCWIRMEEPTLEALRQAFLDHDARIICDWDPRLSEYPDRNPNSIRHGWIERIVLGGVLGNSAAGLAVSLHPALNVIVGGRGSGKSTLVAAIRQLYSGTATLPDAVRQEAVRFAEVVFGGATITGVHRVPNSQEQHTAIWSRGEGSQTAIEGTTTTPTDFRVRVVNQKELFARVSNEHDDQLSASRSFLSFVDEGLGLLRVQPLPPGSWWRRMEDAAAAWREQARSLENLKADVKQLPAVQATSRTLASQVAAFDSPEALARRERNDKLLAQRDRLEGERIRVKQFIDAVRELGSERGRASDLSESLEGGGGPLELGLSAIEEALRGSILQTAELAEQQLAAWDATSPETEWYKSVAAAKADSEAYLTELAGQGIDPTAYSLLKAQLAQQLITEKELLAKSGQLEKAQEQREAAWMRLTALQVERRNQREELLRSVADKSTRLRFNLRPHSDTGGWTKAVRELLGLRADGFLQDVPDLASWLWGHQEQSVRNTRWGLWRQGLIAGDLEAVVSVGGAALRKEWLKRLEGVDEAVRLRLATEIADDTVEMKFLRDGGKAENSGDWQDVTQGSPGQRTAAMLAFVLHHGSEPLVLDQPEDDLDTEWISRLVVRELRASRWKRQIIVVTHNANIPVNGDAERVIVLENVDGVLRIRTTPAGEPGGAPRQHCGALENQLVRRDIQNIMEGGIAAFVRRERKYNNEVRLSVDA